MVMTDTAGRHYCPNCYKYVPLTHRCDPAYGSITFYSAPPNDDVKSKLDEILRMVKKQPDKKCYVCDEVRDFYTVLPYGSFYDGEAICFQCINKLIDPLLDIVRVAKGENPED